MAVIDIATESRDIFFLCVKECNESYRSGHDLELYRQIIEHHRNTPDIGELLEQKSFVNLLRRTLVAWNMDQRGAKLASEAELENSILQCKPSLVRLYQYRLYEVTAETSDQVRSGLKFVFGGLKVMESKRRIVGVSKALHFLIPDLVMPIDSKYTMEAIYGYNKYSNSLRKETNDFLNIFDRTIKITKALNLTNADVSGEQWNTSVPKLIDNAIIGLFSFIENKKLDELMSKIKSL